MKKPQIRGWDFETTKVTPSTMLRASKKHEKQSTSRQDAKTLRKSYII
jgi:hypothetical protein